MVATREEYVSGQTAKEVIVQHWGKEMAGNAERLKRDITKDSGKLNIINWKKKTRDKKKLKKQSIKYWAFKALSAIPYSFYEMQTHLQNIKSFKMWCY